MIKEITLDWIFKIGRVVHMSLFPNSYIMESGVKKKEVEIGKMEGEMVRNPKISQPFSS